MASTSLNRERQFEEIIASLREEVIDQKQHRPDSETPPAARQLSELGAALDDDLAYEITQIPTATYDDPNRGYDRGEWGVPNPATTGRTGGEPTSQTGFGLGSYGFGDYGSGEGSTSDQVLTMPTVKASATPTRGSFSGGSRTITAPAARTRARATSGSLTSIEVGYGLGGYGEGGYGIGETSTIEEPSGYGIGGYGEGGYGISEEPGPDRILTMPTAKASATTTRGSFSGGSRSLTAPTATAQARARRGSLTIEDLGTGTSGGWGESAWGDSGWGE